MDPTSISEHCQPLKMHNHLVMYAMADVDVVDDLEYFPKLHYVSVRPLVQAWVHSIPHRLHHGPH